MSGMNATCKDCGAPVRGGSCHDCDTDTLYHVTLAAALACPGTGAHVEAAA